MLLLPRYLVSGGIAVAGNAIYFSIVGANYILTIYGAMGATLAVIPDVFSFFWHHIPPISPHWHAAWHRWLKKFMTTELLRVNTSILAILSTYYQQWQNTSVVFIIATSSRLILVTSSIPGLRQNYQWQTLDDANGGGRGSVRNIQNFQIQLDNLFDRTTGTMQIAGNVRVRCHGK